MGKLNMDAMKARLDDEQQSGNYSNTDYDKLVQGKNVRRVLWPKGDSENFFSEGYLHFGLGEDGKRVVTCPKTFNSKNKCPICEYVEQLQKSKSKEDKKLADDIKAKRRIYINVLNRDSDDEEDTPKVLPIGVTILKGLLEAICDPDYGDITDPETGRDVTISRTGQGLKTEYSVLPKPKSTVASDTSDPDEIEENMTDLESLFIEKSYEELEAILNGEDEEDDSDNSSEDDGDDEEEGQYDDMEIDELEALCKKRKIKLPAKPTRLKLITLLTKYDEEADSAEDEEDGSDEEASGDDDDDEIQNAIAAALAKRKGSKK